MNKRRSTARTILPDALSEIMKDNTYGGSKTGEGKHAKKPRKEMPNVNGVEGITIEYDKTEEKYPVYLSIKMTDGEWVKYQIYREQPKPVISPALEAVANMKRGYTPKRP